MKIKIVTIVSKHFNLLLRKHLEEHGSYDLTQAANYSDGLNLAKEIKPNIVIIDLDIERYRIMSIIKEILITSPYTKIITLSDSYEYELKIQLLKLGVDNFVTKPFQPAYLWSEIDNIKESLQQNTQDTTFNTNSKENYYKNLNLSIRNQIKSASSQSDIDLNNSNYEIFDDNLDTSNSLINIYMDNTEDVNSSDFELDFDLNFESKINKSQLDISDCNKNINTGYLGLPRYLDREAIYKDSQENEIDSQEPKNTSLSVLKGVFKNESNKRNRK